MLTNEYDQKLSKRLKDAFFSTQLSLLSCRLQLPFVVYFLVEIFIFWIGMSIFFISSPLQPQVINSIFKCPLIPSISQWTGIYEQIFIIFFMIDELALIVLLVVHLRSVLMNNWLTKVLNVLIFENYAFLVIKLHLMLNQLKQLTDQSTTEQLVLSISYAIITTISVSLVALLTYFRIQPFRKKSIIWSLNNDWQFLVYMMSCVRVLVVMTDGRTVAFLIVSFFVEVVVRGKYCGCFTKERKRVHVFASNLKLAVHVALLVGDFTGSQQLASQILCFLFLLSLIQGITSCYSTLTQQRYFPLCQSPLPQFYNFYYHFLQKKIKGNKRNKLSLKRDAEYDRILTIHLLNCHDKNCKVKNTTFSQESYCEDLENLCNELMEGKCLQSKENELVYQLWRFETGRKYTFRMQSKQLQLLYQYIIYCALNMSKLAHKSDSISTQNIKSLKSLFYQKLQNTLQSFSILYQQVTKTQPKLQTILTVGNQTRKRSLQLKALYWQLLKHSVINFKTAQVYVEFQNYFLKEDNVNQQSIQRLQKIQKSTQADNIEEVYLPTLTVYAETGLIENMNTECLVFFRLTRFQMKTKMMKQLIYQGSATVIADIKGKLRESRIERLCAFFMRRGEVVFGFVSVKEKYIDGRKLDLVTIEKNPYSDYRNVMLLCKENNEIQAIQKQQSFIRPSANLTTQLVLKWRYLFQKYLRDRIDELVQEKVVKVRIQQVENSLFVMNLEDNADDKFIIVNIKVIKDFQKKRNRVSSFMLNKPQPITPKQLGRYQFLYDLKDRDSITLYGINDISYRHNDSLGRQKSLGKFEREISNILVSQTLLQENRFSRGIKTYRLWNQGLYNVDLEDKEKYIEQFEDHQFNAKQNSEFQSGEIDLYIMAGIFLTLFILIALSIAYNIFSTSVHENVLTSFGNGFHIEQLRLQMNRMCSVTRDYEDGRYDIFTSVNWKDDLLKAYNTLKIIRSNTLIFDSKPVTVLYRGINYTGTLNEIIDVMISHVFELTLGNFSPDQIEHFHDSYITDLNPKILNAKFQIIQSLTNSINDFSKMQQVSLIIGIICIVTFYVLIGALIGVLNQTAKKKLTQLMMISDSEARMNQLTADKLRYAVDMIKKNFDFDLKALMGPAQKHRPRKKSKQVIIGTQKKFIIIMCLLIGSVVHLSLFYSFSSNVSQVLSKIKRYQSQGSSFVETYSVFTQQTNKMNHLGVYDIQTIRGLRKKVNDLTVNRLNFDFDSDTNSYINLLFYENGCQQLSDLKLFVEDNVKCSFFLQNYTVSNPFQLGMLAYFSKVHYSIMDNITETYGVTGIFAGPFVKAFSFLIDKITNYGTNYIQNSFNMFFIYNIVYIVIGVLYVGVTLMVAYFLKGTNKEISELLKFLNVNVNFDVKRKEKKLKEKEKEMQKEKEKEKEKEKREKQKNQAKDKAKDVSIQEMSDSKIPSSQNSISQDQSQQKQ